MNRIQLFRSEERFRHGGRCSTEDSELVLRLDFVDNCILGLIAITVLYTTPREPGG